jgi:ABC-type Fe3+-hydroxamate transport system substrate-binding protein
VWAAGRAFGSETLVDEAIRTAGATNAASEAGLVGNVALPTEGLYELNPEVVFVLDDAPRVIRDRSALMGRVPEDAASALRAWQRGDVYRVPEAWLGTVSHEIVLGIEALHAVLREPR